MRRDPRLPGKSRTPPKRYADARRPALRAFVRTLPCILADHPDHRCAFYGGRGMECAHWITWQHSGRDEDNVFPVCPKAHDQQEGNRRNFALQWGLDVPAICRQVTARWKARDHGLPF